MQNKNALFVVGGLYVLAGAISLSAPIIVTSAIELFVGWLFAFVGTVQGLALVQGGLTPTLRGLLGIGMLSILTGFALLAAPVLPAELVVLGIGALLALSGALKLGLGYSERMMPHVSTLLLSGLVSLLLGVILLLALPPSATLTLVAIMGLELLSHGLATVVITYGRDA